MTVPVKVPAQGEIMESVIVKGDLSKLEPGERARYYTEVCRSIGLNPLTRPLEYITLNGKLTLYAKRDCADQLRKINNISIQIVSQEVTDGLLSVHVRAKDQSGREDEDLGVVAFPDTLRGEARANAMLKAITKAKRRVTLSISGLGLLDETEVDEIPAAAKRPARPAPNVMLPAHDAETGEVIEQPSPQAKHEAAADQGAPSDQHQPTDGAPEVPTVEAYVEKWRVIVDNASSAAHGEQIAQQWNDEKKLRNLINWPEDETFANLRKKVTAAVTFLRKK